MVLLWKRLELPEVAAATRSCKWAAGVSINYQFGRKSFFFFNCWFFRRTPTKGDLVLLVVLWVLRRRPSQNNNKRRPWSRTERRPFFSTPEVWSHRLWHHSTTYLVCVPYKLANDHWLLAVTSKYCIKLLLSSKEFVNARLG